MKKKLSIVLAVVLVLALGVGATIAYLTANTDPVKNTFVLSNGITLALDEAPLDQEKLAAGDYELDTDKIRVKAVTYPKLAIKQVVPKDPKVTGTTEVPAYIFITINKNANLNYSVFTGQQDATNTTTGWTKLVQNDENIDVYYQTITKADIAQASGKKAFAYEVLLNNEVKVDTNATATPVTTDDGKTIQSLGTIDIKAYAIQTEGFANVTAAWAEVSK